MNPLITINSYLGNNQGIALILATLSLDYFTFVIANKHNSLPTTSTIRQSGPDFH